MAFWSDKQDIIEPLRPYRFRIMDAGTSEGYWWWAKSATKPTFEISKEEYTLINHKIKYPGILTWKDVNIKLVDYKNDSGTRLRKIYEFVRKGRYSFGSGDGLAKRSLSQNYVIEQLDADGNVLEKWTLINAFITSLDTDELSYDSEELSTVSLTISYDKADLT